MSTPSDRSSSSSAREKPSRSQHERSRSREKYERRRSDQNPPENRRAKIRIPELTSSLLSFKGFLQNQVQRINIEQAQRAYEKYKRDWEEKQNQIFVNTYRDNAWFRQKYDPQFLDAIQTQRKQNVKKNFVEFISNFDTQVYKNIDLSIKQTSNLGFNLSSDRFDEQQDSFISLINSQTIDIGLNQSVDITQQPYFGFDPDRRTLFAKNVPKNISRFDIYQVVRKLKGFKNITLSEPVKKNNFSRYCWVEFSDEESFIEADLAMSGLIIKDQNVSFTKSISKMKKAKVLKNYPVSRIDSDVETIVKMAQRLDKQCIIQNNPLFEAYFESNKKKMDTFLLYLRRVHAFDYFTSTSFENERIMSLKMGSIFLRIEANYAQMQGVQTVFKKIKEITDAKIAKQIEIPDYLGVLRVQIEKYIRQNEKDQNKTIWKCSISNCQKKFQTCEFLAKHIMMKHPQIKDKKVKYLMDQAYFKDPNKITNLPAKQDRQQFRGRRPPFNPNFRKPNRRENYKDLDQPEGDKAVKVVKKPLINYLDI